MILVRPTTYQNLHQKSLGLNDYSTILDDSELPQRVPRFSARRPWSCTLVIGFEYHENCNPSSCTSANGQRVITAFDIILKCISATTAIVEENMCPA